MRASKLPQWIHQISILYLALPFIVFCLGWLNNLAGIFLGAIILATTYAVLRSNAGDIFSATAIPTRTLVISILVLGFWVFLSGIGGYAFQNMDHHWRNALFRDLIIRDWPVIFQPEELAANYATPQMLVYYVGFWLPSAVIGKLWGWEAANLALFLWTWLGVALVGIQILFHLRSKAIWPILLFIFFSGMDIVGVLIRQKIAPIPAYITLWPPIQHLENWAYPIQFSANTTQLFWVFNQALPCWIALMLLLTRI